MGLIGAAPKHTGADVAKKQRSRKRFSDMWQKKDIRFGQFKSGHRRMDLKDRDNWPLPRFWALHRTGFGLKYFANASFFHCKFNA